MTEAALRIDRMHCAACIRMVTQTIHGAGALDVEEVRLGAARFKAKEDGGSAEAGVAIAALAKAGRAARVDE